MNKDIQTKWNDIVDIDFSKTSKKFEPEIG